MSNQKPLVHAANILNVMAVHEGDKDFMELNDLEREVMQELDQSRDYCDDMESAVQVLNDSDKFDVRV